MSKPDEHPKGPNPPPQNPKAKNKYRCQYSFPCGKYDRCCYDIVPVDSPDPPGHCNDNADGEDPDWTPDAS